MHNNTSAKAHPPEVDSFFHTLHRTSSRDSHRRAGSQPDDFSQSSLAVSPSQSSRHSKQPFVRCNDSPMRSPSRFSARKQSTDSSHGKRLFLLSPRATGAAIMSKEGEFSGRMTPQPGTKMDREKMRSAAGSPMKSAFRKVGRRPRTAMSCVGRNDTRMFCSTNLSPGDNLMDLVATPRRVSQIHVYQFAILTVVLIANRTSTRKSPRFPTKSTARSTSPDALYPCVITH